jgi:hypothetical protein
MKIKQIKTNNFPFHKVLFSILFSNFMFFDAKRAKKKIAHIICIYINNIEM